jgi:Kef-type K+ transport system membrane component KefB
VTSSAHLFAAIAVVVGAAMVGGRLAALIRQPPVIGEICAGIMLGPSLLGRVDPSAMHSLFPQSVLPMLHGLSELGLVLFMFEVGREFGGLRLRTVAFQGLVISAASLLLPFAVGAWLATRLADSYLGPSANRFAFTVFLGCALSITAFPVLARILADLRLGATRVGHLSLFAAAIGDGGAWLLLTVALAATHGSALNTGGRTFVLALVVAAIIIGPLRWLAARAAARAHERDITAPAPGNPAVWGVVIVVGVTGACAITAAIGIHEIIGAFLAGVACPRAFQPVNLAAQRLAEVTRAVLLPVFFAGFGLTVDLSALPLSGRTLTFGLPLLAGAMITKMTGPALCGRLTGLSWRESAALGTLLNTRGLTELVVLQTGWQVGLIDTRLLAMLTIITILTTAMAGPILHLIHFGPDYATAPGEKQTPATEPAAVTTQGA